MNRKRSTVLCALILVLLVSGTAWPATGTGTINVYHLNSTITGRGVCVQLTPALPTSGGWACLLKANPLYNEITSLLLEGFSQKKSCSVTWSSTTPEGYGIITIVQCTN